MTAHAPDPVEALREALRDAQTNVKYKEEDVAKEERHAESATRLLENARRSLDAWRDCVEDFEEAIRTLGALP